MMGLRMVVGLFFGFDLVPRQKAWVVWAGRTADPSKLVRTTMVHRVAILVGLCLRR